MPHPTLPPIHGTYGVIVTGVGGTGIVTVGAILGMAAQLEKMRQAGGLAPVELQLKQAIRLLASGFFQHHLVVNIFHSLKINMNYPAS